MGVDNFPVLHVPAGNGAEFPADIPCSSKNIDSCRLHAGADQIHVPAFPPDTFVNNSFRLFSNAMLMFAPDAGVSPEPECLVKSIVKCGLLEFMHRPVHPPYQVRIPGVEIIRNIIGTEFTMAGTPSNQRRRPREYSSTMRRVSSGDGAYGGSRDASRIPCIHSGI